VSTFRRDGKWIAKFQLRGQQHWVPEGPWSTKRHAEEAERRHRDRLDARQHDETCASFAERWLEEWPRREASTRQLYAQAAGRFAADFGPTSLGEVERLSARTWALGVPRSLSKIIGTMYEDARNVGLVESNPFSNLRLPATEKTEEIQSPTMAEYRTLLDACTVLGGHGAEFRAMIPFAAWTGVRAGELHAVQWADIEGEYLWVRRSRKTDGSIGKPKNGRERKIVLLPPANVLDEVPRRPDPFVFLTARGEPLQKATTTTPGAACEPRQESRRNAQRTASRTSAGTTCATSARRSF
jgi:integrase